ncbi:hypothetical protein Tco_0539066, partial [Tanacetum coccineum]
MQMVTNTLSMCREGSIYTLEPCEACGLSNLGRAWLFLGFEPETSPILDVSFFTLLRTTDDVEDVTFDVYALPCCSIQEIITQVMDDGLANFT